MSSVNDGSGGQTSPFEDRIQTWQDSIESGIRGFGKGSWARIIKMARKPSSLEFRQTCIVCGIGMFVLGLIGFLMLVLMDNVLPSFFEWLTN
ncbi:MAG: protein translocase SEC61 complex subunit gamma [Candidatus Poseidoniales archaeon]|nr:protein translocase SEC61 complex subunit gamma [Candidatus Poseidoniales archaeon]